MKRILAVVCFAWFAVPGFAQWRTPMPTPAPTEPQKGKPAKPASLPTQEALPHVKARATSPPNAELDKYPVDPEKLGIPDYYDIIKNPMDF